MKKTGAWLTVYALEQVGVTHTFGIPGVHNTEIYDELNKSKSIKPVLVTHECGGAFMADAISRTTDQIGCMVIVPAAGLTHALSGIGEAYLAGIPMLIISGGIRTDTGRSYQLHDIDQHKILAGITKKSYKAESQSEIVPMIFDAVQTAKEGEPGPVFVEIPVNLQLFKGEINDLPVYQERKKSLQADKTAILKAAELLTGASSPGIFAGWGAKEATEELIQLAELLGAPVATTLQGLSVFPGNHPLHTGMGIGKYAVPASESAFKTCDCLLAVGARFGEIATGSFGMEVPEKLIHIDINRDVFNKNYPADVVIHADAKEALELLLSVIKGGSKVSERSVAVKALILSEKKSYKNEWADHLSNDRVNPALFFQALREELDDDAIIVADDGNHTFLTAELMEIRKSKHFISPTDFNCMGYCVPASIGAKFGNRNKQVVGIAGDGAFLMTGMELITAVMNQLGVIITVFNDGELSQISQGQQIPYNRKVCTELGQINVEGVAIAIGAEYLKMNKNSEIEDTIRKAVILAGEGKVVILDIMVDYSKKTRFTKGIVSTNLGRFPFREKMRFIGRAMKRKISG